VCSCHFLRVISLMGNWFPFDGPKFYLQNASEVFGSMRSLP
jgi:hypothetical protein